MDVCIYVSDVYMYADSVAMLVAAENGNVLGSLPRNLCVCVHAYMHMYEWMCVYMCQMCICMLILLLRCLLLLKMEMSWDLCLES